MFFIKNGGVSTARNLGLDNAKGKWITFIDSDDYVDVDFLNFYIKNIDDNSEIIIQSIKVIDHGYVEFAGPKCLIEGNIIDIMNAIKYDGGTIGYVVN